MAESEATRLLENQFRAAQATIRSLTAVVEQAEAHVEDRDGRINNLAADLLEERSQRTHLAKENARLSDEIAQLRAVIVRQMRIEHLLPGLNPGGED